MVLLTTGCFCVTGGSVLVSILSCPPYKGAGTFESNASESPDTELSYSSRKSLLRDSWGGAGEAVSLMDSPGPSSLVCMLSSAAPEGAGEEDLWTPNGRESKWRWGSW